MPVNYILYQTVFIYLLCYFCVNRCNSLVYKIYKHNVFYKIVRIMTQAESKHMQSDKTETTSLGTQSDNT